MFFYFIIYLFPNIKKKIQNSQLIKSAFKFTLSLILFISLGVVSEAYSQEKYAEGEVVFVFSGDETPFLIVDFGSDKVQRGDVIAVYDTKGTAYEYKITLTMPSLSRAVPNDGSSLDSVGPGCKVKFKARAVAFDVPDKKPEKQAEVVVKRDAGVSEASVETVKSEPVKPLVTKPVKSVLIASEPERAQVAVSTSVKKLPQKVSKKQKDADKVVTPVVSETKPEPKNTEYLISRDDVLRISVWEEKDLDQEVIVRPDGKISFPLAGDVKAEGLTFAQLNTALSERFSDYIRFPVVSITLVKLGGRKVAVLGEVERPDVYSVSGPKTVLDVISMARGFTEDAVPSSTLLIRGGLSDPVPRMLDLNAVVKNKDLSQNIEVQPEDIIFVPKKTIANINYYMRQIVDPLSKGATAKVNFETISDTNN